MRPVSKGKSPQKGDFKNYADAKPELVSRLGMYCSYCERMINTNLAVEHIQPKKGVHGRPDLIGRWSNFLLACVNCNSTKGDEKVDLNDTLLPDRDNTAAAFIYTKEGSITINPNLTPQQQNLAQNTLRLVGLDKRMSTVVDSNDKIVAIDRVTQRMEAWLLAEESNKNLAECDVPAMRRQIVKTALTGGFFSIWMSVFMNDVDMQLRFIEAFHGTSASSCFDNVTAQLIQPAPNPDNLNSGSKV